MAHSDAFLKKQGERNALILELRQSGHTYDEISLMVRCSGATVATVCKAARAGGIIRFGGGGRCEPPEKKTIRLETLRQKNELLMADRIKAIGLDYIGGYENSNGHVIVQCQRCGAEFEASCITIRKGGAVSCPACREAERQHTAEEAAKQKAADREAKQRAAEERKVKASERKQKKRQKICKECGKKFLDESDGNSRSYCSEVCSHRARNRLKDARRRGYKSNGTLTKLYYRDGGRCYICGGLCDFDDCQIIDGAFVVGPRYPTVEHVIPICRGGDDGEDNIKLACHRCNSKKSIKSSYKVERFGQIALVV